jgi:hypothetical protein
MYGWGYLFAHGLVTAALIRDNLIAGAIALALVVGLVLGYLGGHADARTELGSVRTVEPPTARHAA